MIRLLKYMIASVLIALGLQGCGDGSCYDNGSAVPLARFYQSGTTTQVTVNNVTIGAIGAPADTLLISNSAISEAYLPLRASATTTRWRMAFLTTESVVVADTITITYRPYEYFASVECGAMFAFDISQVTATGHVIDSVVIAEPRVTNIDQVNLRIYFPSN